jgi:chromosome segregation protein
MLKRLELVGFKSFADKTEFTFSAGVTGIIGPNGSGKSNIVDAVKWVLGEQSAKSLRGGEMADVIFNGSATRRSLGLAEVTMTFDNGRQDLATDAEEVQITRRVYSSGEGEYLINGQICRLKDIKDLFLGSGAGHDAYSIIEQGRVDVLLQASTKERRTIFEEAAGISRFKARKIETLRKLERVDQNLARLRDILDEVEKQLRSVKLQAAKAQRYQEYSARLRELRVRLGLREYHVLTEELRDRGAALEALKATLRVHLDAADTRERELNGVEEALSRLDASLREQEAELAAARQQIAAGETTLGHEWALAGNLENDLDEKRRQLAVLSLDVRALAAATEKAAKEFHAAEREDEAARRDLAARDEDLKRTEARWTGLQEQMQRDKLEHQDGMRQAARLQNDAIAFKAQVDNLARERRRLQQRSEIAAEHLASVDLELQALTGADDTLQNRLTEARLALTDVRSERERLRLLSDETARRAAEARERRSGIRSRIEVLEGLERSHEGLGTGVCEVFALLERPEETAWRDNVLGLVADFLTVRRDYVSLIDVALGERAQRFVVRDLDALDELLQRRGQPFSGRVSFLPLSTNGLETEARAPLLVATDRAVPGQSAPPHGVVAPAERVVRCEDPRLADLPSRLLGRTLIVRDLAAARALDGPASGFRCVTLQGELVETDGTVTVGTHRAETGILSRKSELRDLREEAASLDVRLAELDRDLVDLREGIAALDSRASAKQGEIDVLTEQAADLRSRIGQHQQRRAGLNEEVEVSRSEISALEKEIAELGTTLAEVHAQATDAEASVEELQRRLTNADRQIRELETERQHRQQEALAASVALAHVEEKLKGLRARHQQTDAELRRREGERTQEERSLGAARARLAECEAALLHAYALLSAWYPRKEHAERHLAEWSAERDRLKQERHRLAEEAHANRETWRTEQEQAHARELEVNDLHHRRDTLCVRLREDYQLDLAAVYEQARANGTLQPESAPAEKTQGSDGTEPAPADDEIEELKKKLSRLGNVNMEALQELNELETRANTLQVQFDDLTSAQKALQEIIAKINHDSRKLFTEAFAAIRTHFQELFRKLFGGGMAEIVLEDETDILESGIEIVARPPGKELRTINLMSGGEKTLTAVALLMAIFRSKPSPFCILDEVDAALDEANIGRFTAVLREFLDRSQFILITHSKSTMACADVLYGVTMQESGISKRFAVRFEDWPDEERSTAELPA